MYRGTPSIRNRRGNGSYGATANTTSQIGIHSRANHYNRFERRSRQPARQQTPVADATYVHGEGRGDTYSHRSLPLLPRDYAANYSSDNSKNLDPTPATSLVVRLNSQQEPLTEAPYMKTVDEMPSHLKRSFEDDSNDWYKHVNLLELDLFQKHAYHPMQCYFALKASLAEEAKEELYSLEANHNTL